MVAGLGLILTACGSSDTPTADQSSAPTSAPSAAATTAGPTSSASATSSPSGAASEATITALSTSGTPTDPTVTVTGTGFGARPDPDPATSPQGQEGCPAAPEEGNGFLYGENLYIQDTAAKVGAEEWTAGRNGGGIFACIALIIEEWTPTKVVFSFGNTFGKMIPENYYVMSDGDPLKVTVKGAMTGTA
jgi:hypothetical protein